MFFFAGTLFSAELTFEVVDEINTSETKQRRAEVLLDAYDAFRDVITSGKIEWTEHYKSYVVVLKAAKLVCDPEHWQLRITFSNNLSAAEEAGVVRYLHTAQADRSSVRTDARIKTLVAEIGAIRDQVVAEKDPVRQKILAFVMGVKQPPIGGNPGPPFGLKYKRANKAPEPTP